MENLKLEIVELREAYRFGAINKDCFNRNMARLIWELELCGGAS